MPLTRLRLENFTAFKHLELDFSPGVNVFIGANATGKTHILKVLYAACEATREDTDFVEKLMRVFLPHPPGGERLVHSSPGLRAENAERYGSVPPGRAEVSREGLRISADFLTTRTGWKSDYDYAGLNDWRASGRLRSVYIPCKEMLANAPGFRSMYAMRETHFEEVYADVIDRALLPPLSGPLAPEVDRLLDRLRNQLSGDIVNEGEAFFLQGHNGGNLEFTLLAEGFRKLGLLYRLIENGVLAGGSVLFWDEPEANLNPSMMETVVDILLELQRMGVQIFLATHDFVTLKLFDLLRTSEDSVRYHALYRDAETAEIAANSTEDYFAIQHNDISDALANLYDMDVERALGGTKR
jgi:hypothetical protein